jgi:putative hydrolase of the HAD superfamily
MSNPKVVIFDLGKVLLEFDYWRAARALAESSDLSAEEIKRLIDQSPLLGRYESGGMTDHEFYLELKRLALLRLDEQQFRSIFADIFDEIPSMVALQQDLRSRGVRSYIFSNTNGIAISHVREKFAFFNGFNGYILSYEAGALKPHAPIYEAVERLTGMRGTDLLYIDDRPENIETGRSRGWHTILHHDHHATPHVVRRHFVSH